MSDPASNLSGSNPEKTLSPEAAAFDRAHLTAFQNRERYYIVSALGQGGMGTILEAHETSTDRSVAMKVINRDVVSDELLTRFVEEARITAQLEHPNIVPVHELGLDADKRVFYTMKLVEGATLQQIINDLAKGNPATLHAYPLGELLTIFQKICDAVSFAHSRRVIHRDLKPANIMVGHHGEVLLMDWGLAKRLDQENGADVPGRKSHDASGDLTRAGALLGSPRYMAPEQALAEADTSDERTDIYALGAILFSILSGRPPVEGNNVEEVLTNVRAGRISRLPQTVPPSLTAVVALATSRRREARYQTVVALKQEIAAYQSGFATAAEEATFVRQLLLAIRRHRREAAVGLAGCLLLISVVLVAFLHIAAERRRANDALASLSRAAPLFIAHAKSLASQGHFDDALKELDYASKLQSTNITALLYKANLLETQLRFSDAVHALQSALKLDPADNGAQNRLAICEDLANSKGESLSVRDKRLRLLHVMCDENRPVLEMGRLLRSVGLSDRTVGSMFRSPSGLGLVFTNAAPEDVAALSGIPFTSLCLTNSPRLRDLSFVQGMPLIELDLSECEQVRELEMLRALPLKTLNLKNCIYLTDLEPLSSCPLERLNLTHLTSLTNLAPLRHLPLRILDLREAKNVADITPITNAPLQEIYLYQSGVKTLEQLAPLAGLSTLQVVDVPETDLDDLNKIPRAHLRILRIGHTKVTDFSPLAGSPIEVLHADSLPGPIDLSPLLQCRSLLWLVVPETATNPSILRGHSSLKKVSRGFKSESEPKQLLEEFLNSLSSGKSPLPN